MSQANFLSELNGIVTGDGYKKSIPINLGQCRKYDDGVILNATVTETGIDMLDTGSKAFVIFVDDDQTDMFLFNFVIPQDYDESLDKLRIRALCSMNGGTTDIVYLDAEVYRKRAGAVLSADLDPTIDATRIPAAIADASWREVNSDGENMQGGDALTVVLKTAAHTTDAIHVYGLEVVYAADIVYFDEADRSIED